MSSRTRWFVLAVPGERSTLAGSVATPVLLAVAAAAVAAAAAAARAVLAPTPALAAPPTATVVRVAAAGGALEANKAERPSTANGVGTGRPQPKRSHPKFTPVRTSAETQETGVEAGRVHAEGLEWLAPRP